MGFPARFTLLSLFLAAIASYRILSGFFDLQDSNSQPEDRWRIATDLTPCPSAHNDSSQFPEGWTCRSDGGYNPIQASKRLCDRSSCAGQTWKLQYCSQQWCTPKRTAGNLSRPSRIAKKGNRCCCSRERYDICDNVENIIKTDKSQLERIASTSSAAYSVDTNIPASTSKEHPIATELACYYAATCSSMQSTTPALPTANASILQNLTKRQTGGYADSTKNYTLTVSLVGGLGAIIILLSALLMFCHLRRQRRNRGETHSPVPRQSPSQSLFPYELDDTPYTVHSPRVARNRHVTFGHTADRPNTNPTVHVEYYASGALGSEEVSNSSIGQDTARYVVPSRVPHVEYYALTATELYAPESIAVPDRVAYT